MRNYVSRRDFMKLASVAAMSLPFNSVFRYGVLTSVSLDNHLGRTTRSMHYYIEPGFSSESLGFYNTDTVVRIFEERIGESKVEHNAIWFRTDDGWINSTFVQPVKREINKPQLELPEGGLLCEVTVPYTQAWLVDQYNRKRVYRYYYGSTHWVYYAFKTSEGNSWYRVLDDRTNDSYIVMAEDLRPVTAAELTPISAHIRNKHIEVDLSGQRLTAFENEKPVFSAKIASGYFEGDTPIGEFRVERKQPSRHMAARTPTTEFDLPGVPWVCYISWTGVSLHGTYWHNNYGTPQSHGCINLTPEASKWIYRWTEPFAIYGDKFEESDNGTKVIVY